MWNDFFLVWLRYSDGTSDSSNSDCSNNDSSNSDSSDSSNSVIVVLVTYFSKNNLTPQQPMRYSQGSVLRFWQCFFNTEALVYRRKVSKFKINTESWVDRVNWTDPIKGKWFSTRESGKLV